MINIFPACNIHLCLRKGLNEYYYNYLILKWISLLHHHHHFHQNCHNCLRLLFIISIAPHTRFTKGRYIIKLSPFFTTVSKHTNPSLLGPEWPVREGRLQWAEHRVGASAPSVWVTDALTLLVWRPKTANQSGLCSLGVTFTLSLWSTQTAVKM